MTDGTESGPGPAPYDGAQIDAKGNLVGVQRLKANELRLREVIFQNVANMAPGAAIDVVAVQTLLGRHVIGGANKLAGQRDLVPRRRHARVSRHAEVDHFHLSGGG